MPLTSEQKTTIAELRAYYLTAPSPLDRAGTAESVDQRARHPDPAYVSTDVSVHVEIAPPSPHPHPLLDGTRALKVPERVPVYFYALHSDRAESELQVADTRVVFFIHGGGNVIGHPTHPPFIDLYTQLLRAVASRSGNTSKCVLIAPSYRLATIPENTFPAALQDVVAAYDYVLDKGYRASNIFIAGDSAGASHAVELIYLIMQSGKSAPRGLIPIAPPLISEHDHLRAKAEASTDLLTVTKHEQFTKMYVGDSGVASTDPLVSGIFIPFTADWPKTLILVGSGDLLIDSSRELEKRLSASNIPVQLVEYDERPHGWWVIPETFPEDIQDAVQKISRFILESPA